MAPRSTGTAVISFGLISVPVKIYGSGESKAKLSFNQLHKDCGTRVKQLLICPQCLEGESDKNVVVTAENMIKGYEFTKGQYVKLTAEEIKALEEQSSGRIDIIEFVPLSEVGREWQESTYYLGADKGGDKAYSLLAAAMLATDRAGIGQYASRGKQHLMLLRPLTGQDGRVRLALEQLYYDDELRSPAEIAAPGTEVKPQELELAKMLIDQTSSDLFEPGKYKDTARERMLEAIQRKIEGQDITVDVRPATDTKTVDLMAALQASLAAKKQPVAKAG